MLLSTFLVPLMSLLFINPATPHLHYDFQPHNQGPIMTNPELTINGIPFSTRAHWMRQANLALGHPCPFAAFGSIIVNHTSDGLGELVCTGANSNRQTGNPIMHGIPSPFITPSFTCSTDLP